MSGPSDPCPGLVLIANGVGGLDLCSPSLMFAIRRSRLPLEARVIPWGHGLGRWHADLTDATSHARWAEWTANEIRDFKTRHRDGRVFLVGKSAGTVIVIGALERLAEGTVETAVLLAPAFSPGFDLSRALRAISSEMVVFWSPLDIFMVGIGTWLFGTLDRVRSVSAGLVGFKVPPTLEVEDSAAYRRLRQERWRLSMAPTGYCGGHFGTNLPMFLSRYVVPLFR